MIQTPVGLAEPWQVGEETDKEHAAALAQRSDVLTDEEANRLEYRGNSVSHWVTRAEARGRGLDRAWQAMAKAGYPADGKTELCDAISAALAQLPPRGEPVAWMYESEHSCAGPFEERRVTFTLDRWEHIPEKYRETPLYAAPTGIPRDDARDAARYRWLAADGDRAKRLLNTYSGLDVTFEIDAGIAALHEPTPTEPSNE